MAAHRGAGAGHVLGSWQRHERRLGYPALDEARVGDHVIQQQDELSRSLLDRQEATRNTLLQELERR